MNEDEETLRRMRASYPRLSNDAKITSPIDPTYNCIAYVLDDFDRFWWPWPEIACHWPHDIPRDESLRSFVLLFQEHGYAECDDGALEADNEKIAIYSHGPEVTHAARQLDSGLWTSKLGEGHDIQHGLFDLEGSEYGHIVQFMKRPRAPF